MSLSNFNLLDLAEENKIPLDYVLSKDEILQPAYVIKFRASKNWNIIINLQNLYADDGKTMNPGSHWVALARVKDKFVFFDSYGFVPPIEVLELAKKLGIDEIIYNEKQIQRLSTTICGYYALFFIFYLRYYLSKGADPKQIMSKFNREFREPIENINIFKRLLKRYF